MNMSVEINDQTEGSLKQEQDEETSSLHTETEDLNSPQIETTTENELSKGVQYHSCQDCC